jgi:hypothetical protein
MTLKYFDLFQARPARTEFAPTLPPAVRQAVIYVSVVIGILAVPLIKNYAMAVSDAFTLRNIIIALVVGLAIFPTAYRNAFDRNAPLLSQAGVSVMTGIGWQNILDTAMKATGT